VANTDSRLCTHDREVFMVARDVGIS
jgi:hypothetical protein